MCRFVNMMNLLAGLSILMYKSPVLVCLFYCSYSTIVISVRCRACLLYRPLRYSDMLVDPYPMSLSRVTSASLTTHSSMVSQLL